MKKMISKQTHTHHILSYITTLLLAADILYLWLILGKRGIYADRTAAKGYTMPFEIMMIIAIPLLAFMTIVLISKAKRLNPKHRRIHLIFQLVIWMAVIITCTIIAFQTT